jgi:hypothetical protein
LEVEHLGPVAQRGKRECGQRRLTRVAQPHGSSVGVHDPRPGCLAHLVVLEG